MPGFAAKTGNTFQTLFNKLTNYIHARFRNIDGIV